MKSAEKVVQITRAPRRIAAERAFLPAALEIAETPPSPIGRAISLAIVAAFCVGLLLAAVGTIDIVASAQGKIVPSGRTKIIQPLEAGVVRAIHVKDGQVVRAGDVLIELDPTMGDAERAHMQADLDAARLDVARLTAALGSDDPLTAFAPPADIAAARVTTQRLLLTDQLAEHRSKLGALDRQIAQKRAESETISASVDKIRTVLPVLRQRVEIRETLFKELGNKLTYLEIYQAYLEMQQELAVQSSRQNEAAAALNAAIETRAQTEADWRRGLRTDLVEAERKVAGLTQDVAKAAQRVRLQVLTAPVDGVVQQLAVHTIGGVVTPAQQLLAIVPLDSHLEIEANVSNRDIGFVSEGAKAQIKVDTFNFTRYGLRHGTVLSVSHDAITRQRPAEPGKDRVQGAQNASSEPTGQELLYSARVSLDKTEMKVDDNLVALTPGMAVTVEISTGSRTVLSYLLSPLSKYAHDSLRER